MNALQQRLVTVLRNMDALVTAADIRARCQLPQDLGVIDSHLRGLCRRGKAIEVPPGRFAHRDYRLRPDDHVESQAPESPPAAVEEPAAEPSHEPVRQVPRINKTECALEVLRKSATSLSAAMSAEQISKALGGDIDPNTVSSMLCTRRAAGNTPALVSHKAGDGRLWWAWVETQLLPSSQSETETPQQEPPMADNNDIALTRGWGSDISTLAGDKRVGAPSAVGIDDDLAVMLALDEMAGRIGGREVRDRDLKVLMLGRLAEISLPAVAALLQRIIDEDLTAPEA